MSFRQLLALLYAATSIAIDTAITTAAAVDTAAAANTATPLGCNGCCRITHWPGLHQCKGGCVLHRLAAPAAYWLSTRHQ
jgi:hypothetical protein